MERIIGSSNFKVYVQVTALFRENGNLVPLSFVWEDGRRYTIDKIKDVRPAPSLRAGGAGMRYTCMVQGRQTYLFREEDRWFMERRGN